MGRLELLILAVGLAMDAMAAAVCKGLSIRQFRAGHALAAGVYFGGFQALMPLCGYWMGRSFRELLLRVDHWISFFLLCGIGLHMICTSFAHKKEGQEATLLPAKVSPFSPRAMLPLAIATSMDALAVGVSLAFLQVSILPASAIIGLVTFLLSAAGVWLGHLCGMKYKAFAERLGGAVLIALGVRILLSHIAGG